MWPHLQLEGAQVRAKEADAEVAKARQMGQHVFEGKAALDERQPARVALDCRSEGEAQGPQ